MDSSLLFFFIGAEGFEMMDSLFLFIINARTGLQKMDKQQISIFSGLLVSGRKNKRALPKLDLVCLVWAGPHAFTILVI